MLCSKKVGIIFIPDALTSFLLGFVIHPRRGGSWMQKLRKWDFRIGRCEYFVIKFFQERQIQTSERII